MKYVVEFDGCFYSGTLQSIRDLIEGYSAKVEIINCGTYYQIDLLEFDDIENAYFVGESVKACKLEEL